jgi:hypothetical protein
MLLTLLKNVSAYLAKAIAEEYSRHHLFYLFGATVLNFFKAPGRNPAEIRESGFLLVDSACNIAEVATGPAT